MAAIVHQDKSDKKKTMLMRPQLIPLMIDQGAWCRDEGSENSHRFPLINSYSDPSSLRTSTDQPNPMVGTGNRD